MYSLRKQNKTKVQGENNIKLRNQKIDQIKSGFLFLFKIIHLPGYIIKPIVNKLKQ